MLSLTSSGPVVKAGKPDGTPRPLRLRAAAGMVRRSGRVGLAVHTGDRGGVLARVCVVPVSRAAALGALRAMRAAGAERVLVSLLGDTLTLGATSLLPLLS